MIGDIGDQKPNNTTFVFTKQCNKTGEEFYVLLTNNLYQVNSLSASISTLSTDNVTRSVVDTYCSNGKGNKCAANETRQGFKNYSTTQNEKIEFWFYCNEQSALYNETLNITAFWVSDIEIEEAAGLSGGGIAGIVIACIVVFLFAMGVLIRTKGLGWFVEIWKSIRCCKNKT